MTYGLCFSDGTKVGNCLTKTKLLLNKIFVIIS